MRFIVYTCIFGAYDRTFPPVEIDPACDYVVITDDPELQVRGWRTHVVDPSEFDNGRAANRYYKMLGHRVLSDCDAAIYVDGNIRLLGPPSHLLLKFLQTGTALGVYRHPIRKSVCEEVTACIETGKVKEAGRIQKELDEYVSDGFSDQQGLVEATVLLKNHTHPEFDRAMELWWSLFKRSNTRDQISLPYVLWKTGLPCHWEFRSFREVNPYFGIYPHFAADNVSAGYAYACARAYDSRWYRLLLTAWHAKWRLQRRMRELRVGLR